MGELNLNLNRFGRYDEREKKKSLKIEGWVDVLVI
jgi:hypothetical protein